jgi:hypothetical protein
MRIIKALLVLVFLLPTLAVAQFTPESSFVRIQRDANREPVALQTAIIKYVPQSGQQGVEVDLVSVIHIGERDYYQLLNFLFEKYDSVLYELVAPEGARPQKGGEGRGDNPLAMLQLLMKFLLRLEHQLEVVDYQKANFVHADLSPEGMRRAMRDRGEDEMTVILKIFAELMQKMRADADKPTPPAPTFSIEDLLNATKLKRLMAQQLADAGGDVGLGKTLNQLLVEDRNKEAMKVLQKQLAAGKKKIAIFYGAAHMPDFDKRLADLGMKRTTSSWVDAWNLKSGSGNR